MKIAIYSRKSIETDTGESIKNQINMCQDYFNRQYENCTFEVFQDEGFSGGNINRPSFQRMMELARIRQFDVIAVYKIDRIARNIVDFVNTFDSLEKQGVRLVSITEGFDPSTPIGKMMMLLLASFAEMERMNIAQRIKDNMKELAKIGRWSGGTPPTGYTTVKVMEDTKKVTYLKLIEEESNNIKEIFEKYAAGNSTYQITKDFEQKGLNYPSKTIQNVLNNPTYLRATEGSIKFLERQGYLVYGSPNDCGFLPYNRRPRNKNGVKETNSNTKFVGVSKHEPVIDLSLWIKVQEILKNNATDPKPRISEFTWLAGLVKCKCGAGMYVNPGHAKKNGERNYYFRCSANRNNTNSDCDNKFLRVDYAEKYVLDTAELLLDEGYLEQFVKTSNGDKSIDKEIKSINKKIITTDKSIDNLVDKLAIMSNAASTVLMSKIEELTKQNILLKEELLKLERRRLLSDANTQNIGIMHNNVKLFLESENDIELRRMYLRAIFEYFVWDSNAYKLQVKLLNM